MSEIREVFAGFGVDDIDKAREFYGSTLGLEVREAQLGVDGADVPGGLELRTGSHARILIYPRPHHRPADFTVLNLVVEDIESAVDQLRARGVDFEQYEMPQTDDRGIHRRPEVRPVAWLRDPAGNIISIIEA